MIRGFYGGQLALARRHGNELAVELEGPGCGPSRLSGLRRVDLGVAVELEATRSTLFSMRGVVIMKMMRARNTDRGAEVTFNSGEACSGCCC